METGNQIGHPLDLKRGVKGKGWLDVSALPGGGSIRIPWMAIRGAQNGPTLTVSCGIHGDEYEGGEAIRELWRELDPAQLTGMWIGIPVVNVAAYEAAQRVSPLDYGNMNRIFPGDKNPSVSGLVARRFFRDIVLKSDAVVDFHAGGTPLSIVPIIAFAGGEDELSRKSRALAIHTGIELLWEMPTIWEGNLCVAASMAGVPTVMPEIGSNGRLDPRDVEISKQIILNVMISLGMQEGTFVHPMQRRVVRGAFGHSHVGGLFQSTVSLGEEVEQNQLVATIQDVFGDVLEEVRAPSSGLVCSYRSIPPILPGDQTTFVGEVIEVVEYDGATS